MQSGDPLPCALYGAHRRVAWARTIAGARYLVVFVRVALVAALVIWAVFAQKTGAAPPNYDSGTDSQNAGVSITHGRGDPDEAIRIDTAALESGKLSMDGQGRIHIDRGIAYFLKREYEHAVADFTAAIQVKPGAADAYYNRGLAYRQLEQDDRAIADYDMAIHLWPDFADAYNNRGYIYSIEGQLDRALADYETAIRLNPRLADAYNNRGAVFSIRGKSERGIADYNTALRIDPRHQKAHINRAIAYFVLGQFTTALYDFDQVWQHDRTNYEVALWLHLTQWKAGPGYRGESVLNTISPEENTWPTPLLALFAGRTRLDQVLAAAPQGKTQDQLTRDCTAKFFIGEYELLQKRTDSATTWLNDAMTTCRPESNEHLGAEAELRRLGKQ
jgi:lipoprotein NlpI